MYHFKDISDNFDSRLENNLIFQTPILRITWIPKNLCTTLKLTALVASGCISDLDAQRFIDNQHWIHKWAWQVQPKSFIDVNSWSSDSIAVIRNPYNRLKSALIEKTLYQNNDFETVILPIINFYSPFSMKKVDELTFMDLLTAILKMPDRYLDSHLQSQSSFLSGKYTHLFNFENLDDFYNYFTSKKITIYTARNHSYRINDDCIYLKPQTLVLDTRRQFFESGGTMRFDFCTELESFAMNVASRRYPNDFALWESLRK